MITVLFAVPGPFGREDALFSSLKTLMNEQNAIKGGLKLYQLAGCDCPNKHLFEKYY